MCIIKAAFDADLDVDGGWGYSHEDVMIIKDKSMPLNQLQHTLATMRAYIKMNMTLVESKRYGAINLNEKKRYEKKISNKTYQVVTYEISAMLESDYNNFIQEYKKNQDSKDFDIQEHFNRRKEATLIRVEDIWFEVLI